MPKSFSKKPFGQNVKKLRFFFGFKIGGWQVRQGDRLLALAIPKWSWSKESEEQNAKHDRIFWLKIFLVELFLLANKNQLVSQIWIIFVP